MYDSHIYSPDYKRLKDKIVDMVNGEDDTDPQEVADEIQEIYDAGEMSSTQYDDLMSYIQDLQ